MFFPELSLVSFQECEKLNACITEGILVCLKIKACCSGCISPASEIFVEYSGCVVLPTNTEEYLTINISSSLHSHLLW